MFNFNFKAKLLAAIISTCLIYACNGTDNKPLIIKFSKDSTTILISNIEPAGLLQLKNNIDRDTIYQRLVSVLETPGDNDSISMEREWPGKLFMLGNELIFKPDSAFSKGKTYLVETQLNMSFGDVERMVKGKMSTTVSFQQKLLRR